MKRLDRNCRLARRRQAGLSVVEIMIGLVLGLVLVAGVSSMVVGSRQTTRVEQSLMDMQSIGRVAVQLIATEVRKAGYRSDRETPLDGVFPAAAEPFATAATVVAGDAGDDGLALRFQGSGDAWTADCLGNVIGQGQMVWQTLWLQDGNLRCRTRNLSSNSDQTLALIPQIEAMSIAYGIDVDGDTFPDDYRLAGAVADWSQVTSVNVQLRVVSAQDFLADRPQPFVDFDGSVATPEDRRLRRTYATVIALRNLLP